VEDLRILHSRSLHFRDPSVRHLLEIAIAVFAISTLYLECCPRDRKTDTTKTSKGHCERECIRLASRARGCPTPQQDGTTRQRPDLLNFLRSLLSPHHHRVRARHESASPGFSVLGGQFFDLGGFRGKEETSNLRCDLFSHFLGSAHRCWRRRAAVPQSGGDFPSSPQPKKLQPKPSLLRVRGLARPASFGQRLLRSGADQTG
jgi:hypothetical protein